jgi:hypothetical protein
MFPRFHIPRWLLVHMPRCVQVSIEGDQYSQGYISSGCDEGHDNFYSETTNFDCTDPCLAQATSDGLKRYQSRNPIGEKDGSHVFFVYICRCIVYSAVCYPSSLISERELHMGPWWSLLLSKLKCEDAFLLKMGSLVTGYYLI